MSLSTKYARCVAALSEIINDTAAHIWDHWKHLLNWCQGDDLLVCIFPFIFLSCLYPTLHVSFPSCLISHSISLSLLLVCLYLSLWTGSSKIATAEVREANLFSSGPPSSQVGTLVPVGISWDSNNKGFNRISHLSSAGRSMLQTSEEQVKTSTNSLYPTN